MGWLKLDDRFDLHPKVLELSDAQKWRWIRVLLYCARGETDGLVSRAALRELGVSKGLVSELLELGLLDADGDAYRVHDYLDFNPSKADRELERERWRRWQADRRARVKEAEMSGPDSMPDSEPESLPPRAYAVPSRPLYKPRSPAERAGDVGRLVALLPDDVTTRELVRAEALRSSSEVVEALVLELGAGVVDPVGHALERLRAAR